MFDIYKIFDYILDQLEIVHHMIGDLYDIYDEFSINNDETFHEIK